MGGVHTKGWGGGNTFCTTLRIGGCYLEWESLSHQHGHDMVWDTNDGMGSERNVQWMSWKGTK